MDDLVTWLRAQLDEDERVAREGIDMSYGARRWADVGEPDWAHVARHDPARVLREVEAKRARIDYLAGLAHHDPEGFPVYETCRSLVPPGKLGDLEVGYCSCGLDSMRGRLLRIEALPYSDRPGWREEWRV